MPAALPIQAVSVDALADPSALSAAGQQQPPIEAETPKKMSVWVYAVGPVAFVMLIVMRHFKLVADIPMWAYATAILGSAVINKQTERWTGLTRGCWRLHVRIALHVAAVTGTIYLSGWGPALGMAYMFTAQTDIDQTGSLAWRASLGWSLVGAAAGQMMLWFGWFPSMLGVANAQTLGFLGAFVFGIAIRKVGETVGFTEVAQDQLEAEVIHSKQAEEAARLSEALHRAVVENAAEGIITLSFDGTIKSFNAAAEAMFGWNDAEILGRSVDLIVPEDLKGMWSAFIGPFDVHGPESVYRRDFEMLGVHKSGHTFPIVIATSAILVEGSEPMISGLVRDLSEEKRYQDQLSHQATHDRLTGLPNRVMLADRLDHAIRRAQRDRSDLAVLFVDLDRFKQVNDTLGHTAGDTLLIEVARRIQHCTRDADTVARLGGDEFIILAEAVDDLAAVTDLARRVVKALDEPFHIQGSTVDISASVGIVMSNGEDDTVDHLMRSADTAMYRAKCAGKARYEIFDDVMQRWVARRIELDSALRHAIDREELLLHYQPVVATSTGRITGFEALIRWDRPGHGLVPPAEFIEICEENGLILEIGTWVLNEAVRQAAEWQQRWPNRRLSIAVNVSTRQLLGTNFIEIVSSTLAQYQLDPTLLTIEITESTLIDDANAAATLLQTLRGLGVNLALDDFGTGYSSLTYLRTFPINIIKVDQSFIRTIGAKREDTAIVEAVIALASNLNVSVVAEGVETEQQYGELDRLHCDYLQGYYFSPPCPIAEVPAIVEKGFSSTVFEARNHKAS